MQVGVSTWYSDSIVSLDADASTLIGRMTTPPSAARATLINNLVVALKAGGVWSKLEALWVMAAADSQAAQLNWKSTSFTLSPVNSPTFTTDRGYTGDGATSRLSTGYNVSTALMFGQNNHTFGMMVFAAGSDADAYEIGVQGGSASYSAGARNVAGNVQTRSGSFVSETVANASALGHYTVSRSNSADYQVYKNGAQIASNTRASNAPSSNAFVLLARNNAGTIDSFSTRGISASYAGAALTAGEVAVLHASLNTYMTAVGAA